MDSRARANILGRLQSFLSASLDRSLELWEAGRSWTSPTASLSLREPDAREFAEFVMRLATKPPWRGRFSVAFIDKRFGEILWAMKESGLEAATAKLEELIQEVEEFDAEQIVCIPIVGLCVEVPELRVGRVAIRSADDRAIEELLAVLRIESKEDVSADEAIESRRQRVKEQIGGSVCAWFRVVAEPELARQLAKTETRRALEVLTFANVALYPFYPQADGVIAIEGELPSIGPRYHMFSKLGHHWHHDSVPTRWSFQVKPSVIEAWDEHGVNDLSEILAKPTSDISELDDLILRAVHWLSASQWQAELENRLLNLVMCLETLFGPQQGEPIASTMGESVAMILGNNYRERADIKNFVTERYNNRSRVTHGGSQAVSRDQVNELRYLVVSAISRLISWRHHLGSKSDLARWLERARLGGGPMSTPPTNRATSLSELRSQRGMTVEEFAELVGDRPDIVRFRERAGSEPDGMYSRRVADALGIHPEDIATPPYARWVVVQGHRYLIKARRERPGSWVANAISSDSTEATIWPVRPLEPKDHWTDTSAWPVTARWEATGYTARMALDSLGERIRLALTRALVQEKLPEEPEGWVAPELPEYCRQIMEARRRWEQDRVKTASDSDAESSQ